jgi:hypothetical protein
MYQLLGEAAEVAQLLICMLEVLGSNLVPDTDCPE